MKIVVILGSPHRGNTFDLTRKVEEKLESLSKG